jgi:dinuclear metal center YbgI/SA1388 family protein
MFEEWAPQWVAWEKDNVGLQVGNRQKKVTKILVTLDVNRQTIDEAIAQKADLIISHHPLLFRLPSAVTTDDAVGKLVLLLAENKIALFSAHTNLDYTRGGVSFALAERLGLKDIRFLTPLKNSLAKIIVFVPDGYVGRVMDAMAHAGAGVLGNYSSCSFGTKGTGSFYGRPAATPFLGTSGTLESVEETRLEMITPRAAISRVITALKGVHPYEEPAYDIYFIENTNPNFGMGAFGRLQKPEPLELFLKSVKRLLGVHALRYTGKTTHTVQNIAVCGGAGSDLLPDALSAEADVFITADVRYHTFQKASDAIALIDAGHWETEHVILKPIAARLKAAARTAHEPLNVLIAKHNTNPMKVI